MKLIVSKQGYNAITETDPNNLNFSSDYNTLKYHLTGSKTISSASVAHYDSFTNFFGTFYKFRYTDSITHGLGYVPFFTAYTESFLVGDYYNMCPSQVTDFMAHRAYSAFADDDKIYFTAEWIGGATPGSLSATTFYYKVFKNNLGL